MQTGVICAAVQPGANREEMSRLGRWLAWDSLQELTGKSRQQLEQSGVSLEKLENGKPVWKGIEAGVSISHTGTAAVAASAFFELGVDLERAERESLRVAARMFSLREQDWMNRQRQAGRVDGFSCLWTLREGYAKWTGLGLAGIGSACGKSNAEEGISEKSFPGKSCSRGMFSQGIFPGKSLPEQYPPLEFILEEDEVRCSDPRCQAELMELQLQGKRYRMALVYDRQDETVSWMLKTPCKNH